MTTPLDSAKAKLGRAKEHLNTLQKETSRFLADDPYPVTRKFDRERGQHVFRVHIRRQPDWERWGLMVGDCIHNLRSALDHITWGLAGSDPNDTTTQFPIFMDRDLFKSKGKRQMRRVGSQGQAIIKHLQPYKRPDPESDSLWLIQDFDVADKHRVLVATSTILQETEPSISVPPGASAAAFEIDVTMGAFEDGAEIGTVTLTPPNSKVKVSGNFAFGVAFSKTGAEGEDLIPIGDLDSAFAESVRRVIGLFERFWQRLD